MAEQNFQVSGNVNFANRWRECILYYIMGVLGNLPQVMYRPKIDFGRFELRLIPETERYEATQFPLRSDLLGPQEVPPAFKAEETLVVPIASQEAVERALLRFVKNDRIKLLVIGFSDDQSVLFWKKAVRGDLGIASTGLPTMKERLGIDV